MSDAATAPTPTTRVRWAVVVLALVTLALYAPSLYCGFVNLDDGQYVVGNPFIRQPSWSKLATIFSEVLHPSTVAGYYQPLTMASLMLDRLIDGHAEPRPFVYHLTNVLLHVLNVVLVYLWLRALPLWGGLPETSAFKRVAPWLPLMLAALFAWHPMNVEVVSWVCQRKALLSTTFALAALLVYGGYVAHGGAWRYLLTALLFVLSMMAKPTTWLLPLALLLLDIWPYRRMSCGALLEKLPLLVLAVIGGYIAFVSQKQSMGRAELVVLERPITGLLIIGHNMAFYLGKVLWPATLSTYYPAPLDEAITLSNPDFLIGAAVSMTLAIAIGWCAWRRSWPLVIGLVGFACLLGPVLGAVDFMGAIAADRFAYLPMLMLLPSAAALLMWVMRRRPAAGRAVIPVMLLLTLLLARRTHAQQDAWQTSIAYWQHALRFAPIDPMLWDGLASAYVERYYRNQQQPDGADHSGDLLEAEKLVRRSIDARPTYSRSYFTLGDILLMRGAPADALGVIDRGLECRDADLHGVRLRGQALSRLGRYDEAIDTYQRYVNQRWTDPLGHQYLANVLTISKRYAEAEASNRRALALDPTCAPAWYGIGRARVGLADERGAIPAFEQAIRIAPGYAEAHWALAACYAAVGDEEGAKRGLYVAIRIRPDLLAQAEGQPRFARLRESPYWQQLRAAATQPALMPRR